MTTGPDGALWFTNQGPGGQGGIGRLTTGLTPAGPTNATASQESGRADVDWSAPIDERAVPRRPAMRSSRTCAGKPQAPRMFSGAATSASIAGLTNGTSYQFVVAALNANGTGKFSTAPTPVNVGIAVAVEDRAQSDAFRHRWTSGRLDGIACMTATSCFATGLDGSSGQTPLAERLGRQQLVDRAERNSVDRQRRAGRSRAAGTKTCFAVGDSGFTFSKVLMERWDGTKFVLAGPNLPGVLNDIVCSSATNCFAVGVRFSPAHELIERWNGSKWTEQTGGTPPRIDRPRDLVRDRDRVASWSTRQTRFSAGTARRGRGGRPPRVSRRTRSSTACRARARQRASRPASAKNPDGSHRGIVAKWNGTQWKALPTPTIADVDGSDLADVAYQAATNCVSGRVQPVHLRRRDARLRRHPDREVERHQMVAGPEPEPAGSRRAQRCGVSERDALQCGRLQQPVLDAGAAHVDTAHARRVSGSAQRVQGWIVPAVALLSVGAAWRRRR